MYQRIEQDFPDFGHEAWLLGRASLYFSKLLDDYVLACEAVERLVLEKPVADENELHRARKQRLVLKDEIARRLSEARDHQTPMFEVAQPAEVSIASWQPGKVFSRCVTGAYFVRPCNRLASATFQGE